MVMVFDWTLETAQTFQQFQAGPRGVIRAFPFADLRECLIVLAVGFDAPEPFAVDAVNEILLNVFPSLLGGDKKNFVA